MTEANEQKQSQLLPQHPFVKAALSAIQTRGFAHNSLEADGVREMAKYIGRLVWSQAKNHTIFSGMQQKVMEQVEGSPLAVGMEAAADAVAAFFTKRTYRARGRQKKSGAKQVRKHLGKARKRRW